MTAPRVLALDLSLTAAGVAHPSGTVSTLETKFVGARRLRWLRDEVDALCFIDLAPDLVVIEDYAYGKANGAHQLGELGGVIRLMLYERSQAWCAVPPSCVKKYATGRGNAGKAEVLTAAVRRLGYEGHSFDEADAAWLRALAMDHLGAPVVDVPALHRSTLAKIDWPAS